MSSVEILEVAPRDGFQAVKPFIPTDTKIALIEELAATGIQRLEIGSFVSPKAIPQLADTGEILKRVRLPKGLRYHVLVPNAKGLEMALDRRPQGGRLGDLGVGEPQQGQRQPHRGRELQGVRGRLGCARQGPPEAAARARHLLRLPLGGPHPRGQRGARRRPCAGGGSGCRNRHLRHNGPGLLDHVGDLFGRLVARHAEGALRLPRARHL